VTVLVDTSAWWALLRLGSPDGSTAAAVSELVSAGSAAIIGPIRQEILTGIRSREQFDTLVRILRAFPDLGVTPEDFECAADFSNLCRASGIQGSPTDFLICAVASRHDVAILTTDEDFSRYAKLLPVRLWPVA
jgi:predicted nucleic acid-binding protein